MEPMPKFDPFLNTRGFKRLPAPIYHNYTGMLSPALPLPTPIQMVWELVLQIGNTALPDVCLEILGQSVIGRGDPAVGYIPQIDLTAFGAKDLGISRRHAILTPTPDGIIIRDLGSMNGTEVNGLRLPGHFSQKLNAGDEIQMGNLRLVVRSANYVPLIHEIEL